MSFVYFFEKGLATPTHDMMKELGSFGFAWRITAWAAVFEILNAIPGKSSQKQGQSIELAQHNNGRQKKLLQEIDISGTCSETVKK